jgi:quercetin dioxygenase-like cupin family protein
MVHWRRKEVLAMTTQHATSGTDRRPTHVLSGDGLSFHLADEVREVCNDLERASGGRTAKTLAKTGGLRVTLIVLDAGVALEPEAAAGGASLQVLEGRLRVQDDGAEREVAPGDLAVLSHNLREPVRAVERSAFLLTVAWPEGAGAWVQEAGAGRLF